MEYLYILHSHSLPCQCASCISVIDTLFTNGNINGSCLAWIAVQEVIKLNLQSSLLTVHITCLIPKHHSSVLCIRGIESHVWQESCCHWLAGSSCLWNWVLILADRQNYWIEAPWPYWKLCVLPLTTNGQCVMCPNADSSQFWTRISGTDYEGVKSCALHLILSLIFFGLLSPSLSPSLLVTFSLFLSQAGDLDSVISLHKDYITKVYDRCLLNVKVW